MAKADEGALKDACDTVQPDEALGGVVRNWDCWSSRMLFRLFVLSALWLAAAPSALARAHPIDPASHMDPNRWLIGPIIDGVDYSRETPLHPSAGPGHSWHIDLPHPPGSLHYVTFRYGSLTGKRCIVIRYRLEAAPGVKVEARTAPGTPGIITLYLQRAGDDWSGAGNFEAYRWYATFATQTITPGEHEIVAPLSGEWTAVETSSSRTNPGGFAAAVANADQVGFVLGGGDGYGHGVYATGPARLVVLDFRIE